MPRFGLVSNAIVRHSAQVGVLGSVRNRHARRVLLECPKDGERSIVITLF
jgi:hypothetical protein